MNQPLDPFAQHFDALNPSPLAGSVFEDAFNAASLPEPSQDGPGFFLIDDAGGRFAIERETGIITLAHDDILARESGAVFGARVRVQEPSGETYELQLRLRIDGHVPQIAENEPASTLAIAPTAQAASAPPAPRGPALDWDVFSASAHQARAPLGLEDEPFGALIPQVLRAAYAGALSPLDAKVPNPAPHSARWSL
jgi:hypothetical protein